MQRSWLQVDLSNYPLYTYIPRVLSIYLDGWMEVISFRESRRGTALGGDARECLGGGSIIRRADCAMWGREFGGDIKVQELPLDCVGDSVRREGYRF